MAEKTPEDRRHDVRMAMLGFLLTTLAGGIIAYSFQYFENRQKEKAEERAAAIQLAEQRRVAATALFDELSPLMDKRLYLWRQVAWGIEDRLVEESLSVKRAAYRALMLDWQFRLNRNRALVCRYFGPASGAVFEERILPGLRSVHDTLRVLLTAPPARRAVFKSGELNQVADSVNTIIYAFNNQLAEAIRRGDVGATDPGAACAFSPSPDKQPL